MAAEDLWVVHLGTVEYRAALDLQTRTRDARIAGQVPDVLLLVEHPPVYTRGRKTGPDELTMGEAFYAAKGIDVVDVQRGGKVTYHGPGQLVGYPIMQTDDPPQFVRVMEGALLAALADEGLQARLRTDEGPDFTGVWIEDRKVASIGVHVHRHTTMHGFAVNVDNDLAPFGWVVACGLPDVRMTSVQQERQEAVDAACFRKRVAHRFCEAHGRRQRLVTPEALERALDGAPAPQPAAG